MSDQQLVKTKSMLQIFFILVLAAVAFLVFRARINTGVALALIWSTYTLEQFLQFAHGFFRSNGFLVNVATVLIVIGSILYSVSTGRMKRVKLTTSHYLWIALFGWVTLSVVWGSFKEADQILIQSIPYLMGFVILGPFCAQNDKQIDNAVQTTVFFGGLVLAGMLFCSFGSRGLSLGFEGGKEIEGNPLAVATYGGYVSTCALFSIFHKRGNVIFLVLKLAIAILGLYTIVKSGSRGQLAAVVVACGIWLPVTGGMTFKWSNILLLMLAIGVFIGGVSFVGEVGLTDRWETGSLTADRDSRFSAVMFMVNKYIEAGPAYWLVGLGTSESYKYLDTYPHFVPVEVLIEEGLVGFALFFAFLTGITRSGWRVLSSANISLETRINVGCLLTLFTFQFGLSLKQGSLIGSPLLFCIGLCIAISVRRILADDKRKLLRAGRPFPMPANFRQGHQQ